jgi:hypothetical protein
MSDKNAPVTDAQPDQVADPVLATADPADVEGEPAPADLEAVPETRGDRNLAGMTDPENAHSPMSPDDQVSNEHTGLHNEEHSTHGNTPAS